MDDVDGGSRGTCSNALARAVGHTKLYVALLVIIMCQLTAYSLQLPFTLLLDPSCSTPRTLPPPKLRFFFIHHFHDRRGKKKQFVLRMRL